MDWIKGIVSIAGKLWDYFINRARKKRIEFIENWKLRRKERNDRANNIDK